MKAVAALAVTLGLADTVNTYYGYLPQVADVLGIVQWRTVSMQQVMRVPTQPRAISHRDAQAGAVLSLDRLIEIVWGKDVFLTDRVIYTHVNNLRGKIEENPPQPRHIVSLRGLSNASQITPANSSLTIGGEATLDDISRHATIKQQYAVLATPPFSGAGAAPTYTLSLVGADGKVAATTTAATRSGLQCSFGGVTAAAVVPSETLTATSDRVYYLDGNTGVKWLALEYAKLQPA